MDCRLPHRGLRFRSLTAVLAASVLSLAGGCIPQTGSDTADTPTPSSDDGDAYDADLDDPDTDDTDAYDTDSADDDSSATNDEDGGVPPPSTEVRNNIIITFADGYERPLETSCFYTSPFLIPDEWEFLNASDDDNCDFALQGPFADVAVVAGEMWSSSSGKTFDETVATVRENLEAGAEPDIQILGLLNTGPSGTPLEIYSEEEIDGAQRAVVFTHSSQRRDGLLAYSAVVEMPSASDGSTLFILLWSVITSDQEGLIQELIEAMTTTVPAGLE